MNGLEKMLQKIADESAMRAKHILDDAQSEASRIKEAAKKRAEEDIRALNAKYDRDLENIAERKDATIELRKRQSILLGKKELVDDIILKTKEYLAGMDDEMYVATIQHLYEKHFPTKNATLRFSKTDLKRIPKSVLDDFTAQAKKKKIKVEISEEPANIENGFIVDYNGIEENCSFDALIDDHMLEIQDLISQKWFQN